MDAFEKFIVSDAFFPVLIVLLLLLCGVFLWIILSSKKDMRNVRTASTQNEDFSNKAEIKIIQDKNYVKKEIVEEKIEPISSSNEIKIVETVEQPVPVSSLVINDITNKVIEQKKESNIEVAPIVEEKVQEVKLEEPKIEETKPVELPKIDIPIQEMTDDSITVPEMTRLTSDEGETVEIEFTKPLEENSVDSSEIVNIDLKEQIPASEDIGEKVVVPEITEQVSETPEEAAYEMVFEEQKVNEEVTKDEVIEIPSAFEQSADGNAEINEDIVVEPPHEYTVEKTEIFDFPDFSKLDDEAENPELTDTMISEANKYIESIMTK